MKKQVLFIQGAGAGAYHEDEKLVASLRNSLGLPYEVHYPKMKNEDDPSYASWAAQIKQELPRSNDPVIVVGHSVGASILLKLLCETKTKKNITGIFLLATPFWGGKNGWKYDGYEVMVLPHENVSKLPKDVPIFFYHSHDDEVVPFTHLALYGERFPQATICELKGRGHQLNNDLSDVATDIKKVCS